MRVEQFPGNHALPAPVLAVEGQQKLFDLETIQDLTEITPRNVNSSPVSASAFAACSGIDCRHELGPEMLEAAGVADTAYVPTPETTPSNLNTDALD